MRTLDDRVVVITGAGSGIGRALARDCARRGARLALSDVDGAGLAETVGLVERAGTREVRGDRLDVADRDAVARYARDVVEHFGRVNVMVNNAGVSLSGPFADLEYADMDWIVGVNLWGVVHGTKEFLPHLIASGEGHVVNLSSLFGLVSMPTQTLYNATKYAVRGLTEALREEMLVAGHPVGVTAVHPGGIRTGIVRNSRVSAGEDKERTVAHFDRRLARTTPERAAETIVRRGILGGRARVLVGVDAHAVHAVATLMGSRYQDLVAANARRAPGRPPTRTWGRTVQVLPGDALRVVMTKWGGRPHWEFDGRYLGADAHGDWVGFPLGTPMARPGAEFTTTNRQVGLVPRADLLTGGFLATFHGPGGTVWTYVDMTTRPRWDAAVVRAVDLDLDVVERLDHTVHVDDEDEFAQHRVELGYPAEVVALAESSRDAVLDALRRGVAPFDGATGRRWLAALAALGDLAG